MDTYRNVALGVESAWPVLAVRERKWKERSRGTRALLASILAAVLAAAALVLRS
jgi:hypothetical protein